MELGRITPSWRQIFHDMVFQLRSNNNCFYHSLRDPRHQAAFDHLLKAWSRESAAMGNAGITCINDVMHLLANIHVKVCIEEMKTKLEEMEARITHNNA